MANSLLINLFNVEVDALENCAFNEWLVFGCYGIKCSVLPGDINMPPPPMPWSWSYVLMLGLEGRLNKVPSTVTGLRCFSLGHAHVEIKVSMFFKLLASPCCLMLLSGRLIPRPPLFLCSVWYKDWKSSENREALGTPSTWMTSSEREVDVVGERSMFN